MIDSDTFTRLSLALSFGAPMIWAWSELRMEKPKRRRDGGGNAPRQSTPPRSPDGDDALPPLPDSLRDAARGLGSSPQRPKVPEPV